MGLFSNTCPVCGHEIFLNGYLCSECGYEIHFLPDEVSSAVKKYEEERLSVAKKIWKKRKEEQENAIQRPYAYLVQFDESEAQNVYPLSLGVNYLGSGKADKTHQQVTVGDLAAEHFVIEVKLVDSGNKKKPSFSVCPINGPITIDNPSAVPITSGTHPISKNQDVFAGGLRFRLIGNKKLK
jgi:hypothetical protein